MNKANKVVKGNKEEIHIISHTHWDREWYLPFQKFRLRLVNLIDNLLQIMSDKPDFKHFHLDGQAVILEDYLEIRPERKNELKQWIKSGRILVGPWYILPDEFLVSGESLIRNLHLGHKIAKEFGHVMKVGYVPDCFGHISQLPQIFNGFNIDNCLLWRGIGREESGSEFIWKSPDGSRVFTLKLPDNGGYCYGAALPDNYNQFKKRITEIKENPLKDQPHPYYLIMNGCDHLEPQPHLPQMIEIYNRAEKGGKLIHSNLPDYMQKLKKNRKDIREIEGELRNCKYVNILSGTISTRMYLKALNGNSQVLLEKYAEPLSTWSWYLGNNYPCSEIWNSWKYLLKNQPHDSICGCSVDPVHQQMLTRYAWCQEIADDLIKRSLSFIYHKIDTGFIRENERAFVVYNPLALKRSSVVELIADFPINSDFTGVEVSTSKGKKLPSQITQIKKGEKLLTDPFQRPKILDTKEVRIKIFAENLPQCGYTVFSIRPQDRYSECTSDLKWDKNLLENRFLLLNFNDDGTFDVTHRGTGVRFRNCHRFEDGGDAGDEYNYSYPQEDLIINSFKQPPQIELVESGPLSATFRIEGLMDVPQSLSPDRSKRSKKLAALKIVSYVNLKSGSEAVEIKTEVYNNSRDHRLRILFPTGTNATCSFAGSSFHL
ncbi:MAG: alpha-mannosidase, partial [Fidelibacterota bacterium]